MKTRNFTVLAMVLVLAITGCGGASKASDFSYDTTWDGEGILIKGYTGKSRKVVIPAMIDGLPVVEIGKDAFNGKTTTISFSGGTAPKNANFESNANEKAGITAITIPNTVEEIGSGAFSNTEITRVTLPDELEVIPSSAFQDCKKLTKANLPSSLEIVGAFAFAGCGELTGLIIPDSLTKIEFADSNAFKGCGKLPLKTRQKLKDLGYTGEF